MSAMSGRRSQKKGAVGEDVALYALVVKGIRMIRPIATPFRVVNSRKINGRLWYQIVWSDPVSGDYEGVLPDGRRMLAEVKRRDDRLLWSDLKLHQRQALDENHRNNAVSLVVWVHTYGCNVMRWPIDGFGPRKSLTISQAELLEWDMEESNV